MGKFDGYLLCTDFDGTLAQYAKVSEGNCRAIESYMKEGGAFTLCTGRTPEFICEKLPERIKPNAPLISVNGSVIYDFNEKKKIKTWSVGKEIWNFVEISFARYDSWIINAYFVLDCTGESLWIEKADAKEMFARYRAERVNKAVIRVKDEISDEIFAALIRDAGDLLYVSRSWIGGIELQARDSSKGVAIGFLREYFGDKIHTVVCAGDYENDVTLLGAADISYAVGDAVESLKAVADRITVPCADDAIASIIAELGEEAEKRG